MNVFTSSLSQWKWINGVSIVKWKKYNRLDTDDDGDGLLTHRH